MKSVKAHQGLLRATLSLATLLGLASLSLPALAQQTAASGSATATSTAAPTTATRGLSSEQIHGTMGEHRMEVRDCVVGDDLPVQIDMVVDIVVGTDGAVERAGIYESNAGDAIDTCIVDAIRTIRFPEPSNGRSFAVRYPFVFVTGG
jgi:hypothetical protein